MKNYLLKPSFIEFSFKMPFYEIYFSEDWILPNLERNPDELNELCESLNIKIDTDLLYEIYDNLPIEKPNIQIFYAEESKEEFIYLDLFKEKTDQMSVILFGVRLQSKKAKKIKKTMMKLYVKSRVRSNFEEDYFNSMLFREVQKLNIQ